MKENEKAPPIEIDPTVDEIKISVDDLVFVRGGVGVGVDPVGPANG
jgi:hypothetical protein